MPALVSKRNKKISNKEVMTAMISEVYESSNGYNILSCHSWTFGHIMPCVVRHNNSTEEHSENGT